MEPTEKQAAARTLLQSTLAMGLLQQMDEDACDAAVYAPPGDEYLRNEALADARAIRRFIDALEIAAASGTREERPSSRAPA